MAKYTYLSDLLLANKKWEDTKFKIIVGIRSAGKSYYTQTKMLEQIKLGHTILYIRNTQQELVAISKSICYFLSDNLKMELKANKNGIYNKATNEQYVLFASAKNYKEISSMILPNCYLVIHEEFNSDSNFKSEWLENVINIIITATRRNDFEFIALGNNQRKNNPYFNIFNYEPKDVKSYRFSYLEKNYVGICQYNNKLFQMPTIFGKFKKIISKYMPEFNDTYLDGGNFKDQDALVINDLSKISQLEYKNLTIVYNHSYIALNECFINGKKQYLLLTSNKWYPGWNKKNTFAWNMEGFNKDIFSKSPTNENLITIIKKLGPLLKDKILWSSNFTAWEFCLEVVNLYFEYLAQDTKIIGEIK